MKNIHMLLVVAFATTYSGVCGATTLPVGPIAFTSDSDYDSNFKEPTTYIGPYPFNGMVRSGGGYLELYGIPTAMAVYDISATGGVNGQGGTGGSDSNNDLSNFVISADVASSVAGGIGVGFLLRLNDAEAGGYVAVAHSATTWPPFGPWYADTGHIFFQVWEGADWQGAGVPIFSSLHSLSGPPLAANTFYEFKVMCESGTFSFDFGNGAATANFTDTTVTATSGQVGVILDTLLGSATLLDNFTIASVSELMPGDANGDGKVDVIDLGILATNYDQGGGFDWENADFTGDGFVDVADLGILATYYGAGTSGASVPEPSTITLLLCGLTCLLCWRHYSFRGRQFGG